MQRLSTRERQTFLLKHIEGWRMDEIAESLQTSTNNEKASCSARCASARRSARGEAIMISDDELLLYYYRWAMRPIAHASARLSEQFELARRMQARGAPDAAAASPEVPVPEDVQQRWCRAERAAHTDEWRSRRAVPDFRWPAAAAATLASSRYLDRPGRDAANAGTEGRSCHARGQPHRFRRVRL
jgi:hypothetical protein